ncbi:MAG TPA: glycosyltransferase family 39 protein [Kofleriaceae bacterium]
MFRRPAWQLLLCVAALVWVAIGVTQWLAAAPLRDDEAQYALAAQDFLDGVPARWFYVSTGMNALAVPGVLLGGDEITLRIMPLVVGACFFALTALLAVRAFGPMTAAWSMAILAGSRSVIQRTSELLSDLPAAGFMIGALWILVGELAREHGPRWRIVLAAPLLAAAFYLRYGSCVPIGIIGIATVLVWWRAIARRPWPVLATAGLFILLLVPHMVTATRTMGSPLGILLASRSVPGDDIGLTTYLTTNPFSYFGLLVPIPIVAGVFSIGFARDRRAVFLWLVAIGSFVAIALLTHAQARYVMVATTLLALLGTDALIRLVDRYAGRYKRVIAAVAIVPIVWSWYNCIRVGVTYPRAARERLAGTHAAADVIRRDASGRPCEVLARRRMRLNFHSGCTAIMSVPDEAYTRGRRIYVVWSNDGAKPQPDFADVPGVHRLLMDTPEARVIRIEGADE